MKVLFKLNPKLTLVENGGSYSVFNMEECQKYSEFFKQFPEIEEEPYHQFLWKVDTQSIRKFKLMNLNKELPENYKEMVRLLCNEELVSMNVSYPRGESFSTGMSSVSTAGISYTSGVVTAGISYTSSSGEAEETLTKNPFLEILSEM